jgi:hypothetical protein
VRDQAQGTIQADALYQGPYWSSAKRLVDVAQKSGFSPKLWICSAGYGLIPEDESIASYDATFSLGEDDSVGRDKAENRTWWEFLKQKRSLASLCRDNPGDTVFVVVSSAYLHAVEPDLVEAYEHYADEKHLVVLTGAKPSDETLREAVTQVDARLLSQVGGSFMDLFPRAALKILEETQTASTAGLRNACAALEVELKSLPPFVKEEGKSEVDDEIRKYIRDALHAEKTMSKTRLLKKRRSEKLACEQKRFYRLFEETKREL